MAYHRKSAYNSQEMKICFEIVAFEFDSFKKMLWYTNSNFLLGSLDSFAYNKCKLFYFICKW